MIGPIIGMTTSLRDAPEIVDLRSGNDKHRRLDIAALSVHPLAAQAIAEKFEIVPLTAQIARKLQW